MNEINGEIYKEIVRIYQKVLTSTLDIKGLVNTLISEALWFFPSCKAQILTYNERRHELQVVSSTLEKELDIGTTYIVSECVSGLAVERRGVIYIPDVKDSEHSSRFKPNLGDDTISEMVCRIETSDTKRVLGVFNIEHNNKDALSERDQILLQTMCEAAAPGFMNARFIESIATLRRLDRLIMQNRGQPQTNLQSILDFGLDVTGDEEGQIIILDKENNELVVVAATKQTDIGLRLEVDDCISGLVFNRRVVYADDTYKPEWNRRYKKGTIAHQMRSEVAVRLEGKNGVLGAFNVERRRPEAFSDYELQLIRTLAGQAQIAIENVLDSVWSGRNRNQISLVELLLPNDLENQGPKLHLNLKYRLGEKQQLVIKALFKECDEILLSPLVEGWSGAKVFIAEPSQGDQPLEPYVIKLGPKEEIQAEMQRYSDFVDERTGGGRYVKLSRAAIHLPNCPGGIAYTVAGGDIRNTRDFEKYFKDPNVSDDFITITIDYLFNENLALWYTKKGNKAVIPLCNEYKSMLPKLDWQRVSTRMAESFGRDWNKDFIELESIKLFPNPVRRFFEYAKNSGSFLSHKCTIHGDFNPRNILVDGNGAPWIIDFASTGPGHILADHAELEAAIKFTLLGNATFDELIDMERVLIEQKKFREDIPKTHRNPQVQKALYAVSQIRKFAEMAVFPMQNRAEYYIPLLFYSINLLRFQQVTKASKECILYSAHNLLEIIGSGK